MLQIPVIVSWPDLVDNMHLRASHLCICNTCGWPATHHHYFSVEHRSHRYGKSSSIIQSSASLQLPRTTSHPITCLDHPTALLEQENQIKGHMHLKVNQETQAGAHKEEDNRHAVGIQPAINNCRQICVQPQPSQAQLSNTCASTRPR